MLKISENTLYWTKAAFALGTLIAAISGVIIAFSTQPPNKTK
jgi:hypothetical protein